MVTTEMVSSTSNTARGFLPGGGLAAGPVIVGGDSLTNQSESVASKVWDKMTAAEERTRLLEGLLRQGVGTADIETRYLPKGKQGKGS